MYLRAKSVSFGYKWEIYKYDSTGNREVSVKVSDQVFVTKVEAIDAGVEYVEGNDMDVEIEF